jgi:hypothetical protein
MSVMHTAERRIKALQKEFLAWVEAHPILHRLPPTEFNDLRRQVFRGTFEAYRLGVVGNTASAGRVAEYFLGWLHMEAVEELAVECRSEVTERCFLTALEAYRIGVMVTLSKRSEDLYGSSM